MNNYIEYFTNYVSRNYDINDKLVQSKYYHSLRVAYNMYLFANKLNMSDEDKILAFKLGLCHDLGRFYEAILIGKFDNLAFDHGAYSNKILYNDGFIKYMDVQKHLLFKKAIYNHNKKDVTNDLNRRELVFTHLLRDADKIDILGIKGTKGILDFDVIPSENVINNYLEDKSIDIKDLVGTTDSTILFLSFIKDLYFKVSHDLVFETGYVNNFLNRVRVDESKIDLFNSLVEKISEERGKVYVR